MSNKLIDLNALSSYKTQSDLKYQDKLTAGSNISINNGVISATAATYSAGDNISINNAVISADLSSVYNNSHATGAGGNYVQCPKGETTTIFTATQNCKITISLQINSAVNSGRNARIYLNGVEAYSFYSSGLQWQRIGHAFLMLQSGDVVSVYNDYGVMMDAKMGVFY